MKAKVNVGDVVISLPVGYLDQQTVTDSIFENVPNESVDVPALIEANRTIGVSWYKYVVDEDRQVLHISVPTDLIKWEE